MRPIRLHLDTSDYSAMHEASPGTPVADVYETLKERVRLEQIEIGLSYHVIFELLRKAGPEHRENRLGRAQLLTELCGRNAFPYPTDLGEGHRFSKEALWQPRITLDDHEIEATIAYLIRTMEQDHETTPHVRRIIANRKYFARWAIEYADRLKDVARRAWPLMFGRHLSRMATWAAISRAR